MVMGGVTKWLWRCFSQSVHLILGLHTVRMDNLTVRIIHGNMTNYTEPRLPENPIRYNEEEKHRIETLMLMMAPLWVMSAWFVIYILIIFFNYTCDAVKTVCIERYKKTTCSGEFKCKKGCENCAGRIFYRHSESKV
ncbi:MAG: hypothetical protein MJE68_11885 [Proteobacteria bacterium]|nr:hypothetical protein [Pseudomonadota bacterium]